MQKNPTITISDCGLPYDYEDFGLDRQELREKYRDTGEHPEYTLEAYGWADTDVDYWTWVLEGIAQDDEDY